VTSVLIADNHSAVLECVVPMLELSFEIVGTASDGKAAVEAEDRLHPDAVVLDKCLGTRRGENLLVTSVRASTSPNGDVQRRVFRSSVAV